MERRRRSVRPAAQILPTETQLRLWRHRLGQKASGDTATAIESIDHKLAVYSRLEKKLAGEATALVEKITGGGASIPDLVRLINLFLRSQIFDQYNIGYNIPGKPSFGIIFYRDNEQNMSFFIGPLISKKGVGEQWLGAIMRRVEGIGRG